MCTYDRFTKDPVDFRSAGTLSPGEILLVTPRYTLESSLRIVVNKFLHTSQPPASTYDVIRAPIRPRQSRKLYQTMNIATYRALLVELALCLPTIEAAKDAFDDVFRHAPQGCLSSSGIAQQLRRSAVQLGSSLHWPQNKIHMLREAVEKTVAPAGVAEKWVDVIRLVMPLEEVVETHRRVYAKEIQRENAAVMREASEWLSEEESTEEEARDVDERRDLERDRVWDYGVHKTEDTECVLAEGHKGHDAMRTQHLPAWTANVLLLNSIAQVFKQYLRGDDSEYQAISRTIMTEMAKTNGSFQWAIGIKPPYQGRLFDE